MFIPWSFKLLYAIVTDSWRPMGLRRKPFMIAGWIGVLFFTLLLACTMEVINAKTWLVFSILSNACLMLADVPADGKPLHNIILLFPFITTMITYILHVYYI